MESDSILRYCQNWAGFSDTRWNLRIACWCGEASTHTHVGIWSGNPFSVPNIRLVNEQGRVCVNALNTSCADFSKFPSQQFLLWDLSIIYKDLNENPLLERDIIVFCISLEGRSYTNWFNLKEKQFNGRKEDGGLERPKLGVLPQGAKLGWPAGGISGWLGVSRRTMSSMEVYDVVEKRELKRTGPTQVSPIAGRFFPSWATREAKRTGGGCQRPITGF